MSHSYVGLHWLQSGGARCKTLFVTPCSLRCVPPCPHPAPLCTGGCANKALNKDLRPWSHHCCLLLAVTKSAACLLVSAWLYKPQFMECHSSPRQHQLSPGDRHIQLEMTHNFDHQKYGPRYLQLHSWKINIVYCTNSKAEMKYDNA